MVMLKYGFFFYKRYSIKSGWKNYNMEILKWRYIINYRIITTL